jgi:hypothetical protein
VGETEGKRPLGKQRCKRADNIKVYLRKRRWSVMDSDNLAQDKDQWRVLVNAVMNLLFP